jgi:hypothetical protein
MRIAPVIGILIVCAAACGDDKPVFREMALSRVAASPAPRLESDAAVRFDGAAVGTAEPPATFSATQKLIRTAELRIQVRDVPAALRLTDSIAQSWQAVLANSRTSGDANGKRTAEVVLRVPSQQFGDVLKSLRGLGVLQNEAVCAQDLTKDYADLETRLLVKQETVTRLRGLLENRTAKLSDVLEVERELARAVAELEQMKGERRFYDQQVAMSTVSLTFFESVPSRISDFTKPVVDALHESLEVLGTSIGTVIYLAVALMPWAIVGAAVAWLAVILRRRFFPKSVVAASLGSSAVLGSE